MNGSSYYSRRFVILGSAETRCFYRFDDLDTRAAQLKSDKLVFEIFGRFKQILREKSLQGVSNFDC
ncbi:hypothetical protein T4B_11977 [Trichinella pseudospiralis]|uniref:Uncharacterized protein n=1 Tax=Trichinella pseudospiralis TaxID=6337 RepID=A0A0V1IBL0_TRIPS|nr:hypothetical protein T4B_11977 [Trichinella pseudospiralis]